MLFSTVDMQKAPDQKPFKLTMIFIWKNMELSPLPSDYDSE